MKLSSLVNINKLYLKKIKKNELEKLRNERNSHEVRKKMLNQEIISKKKQLIWFKEISKSKNNDYFNIYYEKELIGSGSLKKINKRNKNCLWGFYIFRNFMGPYGVISEFKIIDRAFTKYKLDKIYGYTLANNSSILKVHKFFKFKTEGVLKRHVLSDSTKQDLIITSLFKKDWKKTRRQFLKKIKCKNYSA